MKKTTRNYVRLLIANVLLIGCVAAIWQFRLKYEAFAAAPAGQYQKLPSAIFLKDLKDEANLTDIKGQWSVVNIWATWCPPCLKEMPALEAMAGQRPDVKVLAISIELSSLDKVAAEMDRVKAPPMARNWDKDMSVATALNVNGLPCTYILDPEGNIRATIYGDREWASPAMLEYLDDLMAGRPTVLPSVPEQS